MENIAKKLVKDMHYEGRVRCVVQYHAEQLKKKIRKKEARQEHLTREQFMKVSEGCLLFHTLPQLSFLPKLYFNSGGSSVVRRQNAVLEHDR